MRNLFATTALAVALASAAFAQTTTQPAPAPPVAQSPAVASSLAYLAQGDARDVYVSDLIGATLYAADAGETTAASRGSWESVGAVHDVLLSRDGEVRALLVDVGTFLGMGGKTIAVPLGAVRYVEDGEKGEADAYFLVIDANRETLQGAPAYDRPSFRAEDDSMTSTASALPGAAPIFAHEGYGRADNQILTVADLEKATVYGGDDVKIGSIGSLVLAKDGKISAAVIDVGGFLGIGAHPVSMPFADLTVLRKTGGDDLRVYVHATKASLKAMPAYKG